MTTRWIPLALALAWGLNWPAIKIVLGTLPPFTLRAIGLGGAAMLLAALALVQGRRIVPPRATWAGIAVAGALSVVGFNFSTAFAQLNTSTSRAAVLTYTMPMMSAAFAWIWLKERPDRRARWALAFGGGGLLLLALPVWTSAATAADAAPVLKGLLFPLLAAFCWAAGTIATKYFPPVDDRVVATAWQLGLGGVCGLIASLLAGEAWPAAWPVEVSLALAYHVAIATAFAYVLWYRLLDAFSATVSSLTALAVPVVGVLGAMALVGDRPSALDWVGFAGVLAGAALVLIRPAPTASASRH
jgi:drug/metabolite transporter (DMT)-like permease